MDFNRPLPLFSLMLTSLMGTLAYGDELPKRKPGLWEIKTSATGPQGQGMPPVQHCIDEKTDQLMQQSLSPKMKQDCSRQEIRRDGNRITVESVCRFNSTTAATRAVFSGDFSSNYRGDIVSTFDPPMMGQREHRTAIEARWLGPCQSGQKPGDMILPGSMRFNPADLPRSR